MNNIKRILHDYFVATHRYGRLNGEEYYIDNYEPSKIISHKEDQQITFERMIKLEEKLWLSIKNELKSAWEGGSSYQKGKNCTFDEYIYHLECGEELKDE